MRTSGVLCTLLLMVGACCAFPQYGPQQQQQEQEPVQVELEAELSEQEKDALGEFWWQNQGVFNGEGGTIVVVQDPVPEGEVAILDKLTSPFIPSPSPDCAEFHGCIPWQYCVDGVFTNTGEGLLALRTPSKVPETYTQKLCGQIGNICCRIPDAMLAEQQPSSGRDDGPYDATNIGGGIIEVVSTDIGDGTSGGIIEVISTDNDAGTIVVVDTTNEGPGIPVEQQVQQAVVTVATPATGCPAHTHDCVPYFQCNDGEINTSGAGIIDVRIRPKACTNPEYPEVNGICCKIPGATPPPTPAPVQTCPGTTVCQAGNQCLTDDPGTVDSGLYTTCFVDYVDASSYVPVTGVCCQPPPTTPPALVTCPGNQVCVTQGQCLSQATDNYDVAQVNKCYYSADQAVIGDCCDPPPTSPPGPVPLVTCPGTQDCVESYQCNADGTINTDGSSLINIRISHKVCYIDAPNQVTGVCCQPPTPTPLSTPAPLVTCTADQNCLSLEDCTSQSVATGGAVVTNNITCYVGASQSVTGVCCPAPPTPLATCLGNQLCVPQGQCLSQGSVGTDNYDVSQVDVRINDGVAQVDRCYYSEDQTVIGECCDPPTEPPTPAPVITCPVTQECVASGQCNNDGTVNTDGSGLTDGQVYNQACYIDVANDITGICCQPPPLVTCPADQICLSQGNCTSQSAATGGTGVTSYSTCYLDEANDVTGVCCNSPIRVVDVCPGESNCVPHILCQGEILDDADQYAPYSSSGTWSQCSLGGDLDNTGVCCRDPVTVVTPSPYVPSNKCGVRNLALDLRTGVKLAKNEAQFGEFPWQAIIFFTNYTFKCGASLIEDRWLITAAHCVHGYQYNDFQIRLGEWQVDQYHEPLKYVDVDIASISIHPDFKPGPVHNDIALIELTAPVTLQYHINTVCLPNRNQIPPQGTRCFATGWGKDAFNGEYQPILKKVDVPVVEKNNCQELLRKTRLGKYFILDKSFMCAGGEENVDTCEGDGGGPLVCEDLESGTYYLAGITAFGIDCGQKDVPGVYADVQLFRDWIDPIVYEDSQQQQVPGYGRK